VSLLKLTLMITDFEFLALFFSVALGFFSGLYNEFLRGCVIVLPPLRV
jgi:hypothetical protein